MSTFSPTKNNTLLQSHHSCRREPLYLGRGSRLSVERSRGRYRYLTSESVHHSVVPIPQPYHTHITIRTTTLTCHLAFISHYIYITRYHTYSRYIIISPHKSLNRSDFLDVTFFLVAVQVCLKNQNRENIFRSYFAGGGSGIDVVSIIQM